MQKTTELLKNKIEELNKHNKLSNQINIFFNNLSNSDKKSRFELLKKGVNLFNPNLLDENTTKKQLSEDVLIELFAEEIFTAKRKIEEKNDRIRKEKEEKNYLDCYYRENWSEACVFLLWSLISIKDKPWTKETFLFQDKEVNFVKEIELKVPHLYLNDWNFLIELEPETHNDLEGWTFQFNLLEDENSYLEMPRCFVNEYTSDTITAKDNYVDANADILGTNSGIKAKRIYLVYIEDIKKYGYIKSTYWCT